MKRIYAFLLLVLFLPGCTKNSELNDVMSFRQRLLTSEGVAFRANITADYGDAVYTFSLDCTFDKTGAMTFTVVLPESIAGITGSVSKDRGALSFDDEVLLFPLLADDQVTPVSTPWLIMQALRSGYIQGCGVDGENLKVLIDDSYASGALQVELWFSEEMVPVAADIFWQNRRILAIEIASFTYL